MELIQHTFAVKTNIFMSKLRITSRISTIYNFEILVLCMSLLLRVPAPEGYTFVLEVSVNK